MVPAANPSPSIELRLLGPLSATVDSKVVPIGGPRQMAVLARLMLTPDQVVSMDQLVESVWDGDEPSQPQVAIRSYISNLRRAIEPNRERGSTESCLASSPPGYRLDIAPTSVDWIQFERLVSEGRRWLLDRDPSAAVALLRQSSHLWRGAPCAGLPESPFFVAQAARLTEVKETAIELLFESLLALGDPSSVASEVEAAIAENPLRERLTELGMLAFYRSGRQSEALALGRRLRDRLVEGLGVDPSRSIDTLELKILNHDSSLDQLDGAPNRRAETAVPTAPTAPIIDVGGGPTVRVGPGLADTGPPLGRDRELAMLGSLQTALDAGRSATAIVTGEQGIGKSRLARHAAEQMATRGVKLGWARCVPGEPAVLWPWAQVVLSLLKSHGDRLPFPITGDLVPLVALGPSVAGALGLDQPRQPDGPIGPGELKPAELKQAEPKPGELTQGRAEAKAADRGLEPAQTEVVIDLDSLSTTERAMTAARPAQLDPGAALVSQPEFVTAAMPIHSGSRAVDAPEFDQAEVMLAVTSLLERMARNSAVTVIFEDLQWADSRSVALLSYAASTLADSPVGFLLTWRETDLAAGPVSTALRELSRLPALIRIELEGLEDQAIADLAQSIGRSLSAEDTANVHRRSAGNPLFAREVLSHSDMRIGNGQRWSTVIDTVTARVERLPDPAPDALQSAALFRRSFSAASVAPLCGQSQSNVQDALNQAVLSGVLVEADAALGTYRFRQPLVAEVLVSQQLTIDTAQMHREIGHQFLRQHRVPTSGSLPLSGKTVETLGLDGYEVAFHLSKSPSAEDRILGGRVALALVTYRLDMDRLAEIESCLEVASSAASVPGGNVEPRIQSEFTVDALLYGSWRAWIGGNRPVWQESARQALELAVANCPPAKEGRAGSRVKSQPASSATAAQLERNHERLDQAVMNIIARPPLPVGPTDGGRVQLDNESGAELLTDAVDRLSQDYPATWAARLYSTYQQGLNRPGCKDQQKVARDALKLVTSARKRLEPNSLASVMRAYVARFSESVDNQVMLSLLSDMGSLEPVGRTATFAARFGYPALLELERLAEARQLIESTSERALAGQQPFPIASTRLLQVRHLLWIGDFDRAQDLLTSNLADWSRLGLPEPLPLTRQRVAAHVGAGRQASELADHDLLAAKPDRISMAEWALRLARRERTSEAIETLDRVLGAASTRHVALVEQAHLAVAAVEVGHEKASLVAAQMLEPYGDQLVFRRDGSMNLGPASLFAGVAMKAAGDRRAAARCLESATLATKRTGGSPIPVDLLISDIF